MRLNVQRLLLLASGLLISACLFSWPEALPASEDAGVFSDAAGDAAGDDDAMADAGSDGQVATGHFCDEYDGGPGSRCWDFDDGGISTGTFLIRAVPDASYPTYASSEVSAPYAVRFSMPATGVSTANGNVSSLEWVVKGNGTKAISLMFDAILDVVEPNVGVNLAIIKGTAGPYSARFRIGVGGQSIVLQDLIDGGTTDDSVLVRLDGGTIFASKTWHHVTIVLDLNVRTYTVTVDGIVGTAGITSWWPSSGDFSVIFGLAFPGAPTTGWVARFDNVVITTSP